MWAASTKEQIRAFSDVISAAHAGRKKRSRTHLYNQALRVRKPFNVWDQHPQGLNSGLWKDCQMGYLKSQRRQSAVFFHNERSNTGLSLHHSVVREKLRIIEFELCTTLWKHIFLISKVFIYKAVNAVNEIHIFKTVATFHCLQLEIRVMQILR